MLKICLLQNILVEKTILLNILINDKVTKSTTWLINDI